VPTVTLSSGDELPAVGLGTWDLDGDTVDESVRVALDGDYTHVDTAEGYHNEGAIGDALAAYDRDDLFLTSKVLPKNLTYGSVVRACERSLDRLGTDYLDLYLIHWPNPAISLRETLDAMETLHDRGKIRNVGVSNFTGYQLSNALHISDVPIAVNQIEFNPLFQRTDLVEYCQSEGVAVEAAAPLARTEILGNDTVRALADEYDKTPAQIVLRWAVESPPQVQFGRPRRGERRPVRMGTGAGGPPPDRRTRPTGAGLRHAHPRLVPGHVRDPGVSR
jgi:diketogulonate reductase-like aldo/keto reductase